MFEPVSTLEDSLEQSGASWLLLLTVSLFLSRTPLALTVLPLHLVASNLSEQG